MRADHHELPTLRTTLRARYVRVLVWCKACRHQRDADLQALIDAGRGDVARLHHPWPKASRTPTTAISFAIISVRPASGDVHDPGDAEPQDQKARHPGQEPVQQGHAVDHARPRIAGPRNSRRISVSMWWTSGARLRRGRPACRVLPATRRSKRASG